MKFQDPPPQIETFNYQWQRWLYQVYSRLKQGPFRIIAYAKADLPTASDWSDSTFSAIIYVKDDVGGAVVAFSDGTNWRRVTDRAIIS